MLGTSKRLLRTAALAATLLLVLGGTAHAADTVVTFGFDDGLTSQYVHRNILTEHGIHATFFINSGMVGNPNRMTWADIAETAAEGNEIGGHTVDHAHLTSLDQVGQQHQICDDKAALEAHGLTDGYTIRNLAYPFGLWNATTKVVAAGCGYDTGRTTGGTDWPEGPIYAETFPPLNAYTLRAIEPRLDTDFATWQDIVQKARDGGGGWVDVVMHDLCDLPCAGFDEYSVSTQMFEQVLDWLDTLPDVKIRTTAKALAVGTDTTAPIVSLTAPAAGATVAGTATLTATASDAVGVDHVDFLVGGVVVGSDASAPYAVDWDSAAHGPSASIVAKAYDEAGNHATATAHTVMVADVTAPSVALTAPADGATVSGTVALSATASDDRGVDHVDFLVDGDVVGSDASAPYAVDWDSSAADASERVTAKAYDAAGNATVSTPAFVTVPDLTPPTVSLTAPADGATVTGTVALTADAGDDRGVARVDFTVDGGVVGSDTTAPYSIDWDSSGAGDAATITATAYDDAPNATASASRVVTVFHPDVTAPVVALTAPANGAKVTGTVALTADASDDRSLDRVDFLVGGIVVGSDASAPYGVAWDSSAAGDTATIAARAYDASGNAATSAASVTVLHPVDPPPAVPPILDPPPFVPPLVSPAADTRKPSVRVADVVLRGDQLLVIVDARDAGGVRAVRVLLPGNVVRTDRKAPFAVTWRARSGRHVIAADAVDRAGNRRRSASVRVDVRRARTRGSEAVRAVIVRH